MREIKFRARRKKMVWITMYTKYKYEPGEMVYGSLLDLGGDDIYIVVPNDYEEDREYKEAPKEAEYIPVYRETVGQYTGLKDKNGKEIYEGDVVEFDRSVHGINGHREVEFKGGAFGIRPMNQVDEELWWASVWNMNCKVIGTIWEHPHLLEGRDEA